MKKTLLIGLCCLCAFSSKAQNQFAPIGATWFFDAEVLESAAHGLGYDIPYGIVKVEVEKDTVFAGQPCKKITQKLMQMEEDGSDAENMLDLFWYEANDTVFAYNYIFERFTPLYIFNLEPGDTFHIPILQTYGNYLLEPANDSTFMLVLDSVAELQYDTTWATSYYMHTVDVGIGLNPAPGYMFSWSTMNNEELQYNNKTGCNPLSGLYPTCMWGCNSLTKPAGEDPHNDWGAFKLRCYHDSFTEIKYVENCFEPMSAINQISGDIAGGLYPNPVNDFLNISPSLAREMEAITICNIQGKIIKNLPGHQSGISTEDLSSGMYIIKWINKKGLANYRKIMVMH